MDHPSLEDRIRRASLERRQLSGQMNNRVSARRPRRRLPAPVTSATTTNAAARLILGGEGEGVEFAEEPAERGWGEICPPGDGVRCVSVPPPGAAGGVEDEGEIADLRSWQEREIRTRHAIVELEATLATDAVLVGRAFAEAGLAFDVQTFIASRVLQLADSEDVDACDLLVWLVDDGSIDRSVELALEDLDPDSGVGT